MPKEVLPSWRVNEIEVKIRKVRRKVPGPKGKTRRGEEYYEQRIIYVPLEFVEVNKAILKAIQ